MMLLLPVLVIALIVLFPDVYIYFHFISRLSLLWKVLWWMPLAFLIALVLCNLLGWGYSFPFRAFFLLLTCVVLPKFLFAVVDLVGRTHWLAALVAALSCCCFLYGAIWGWKHLVVTRQAVSIPQLPEAFRGYKIVQLSDLHVGTYGQDTAYFRRMVQLVNAQQPDLVVFTGDLVNSSPDELDPFMEVFRELKAQDGVFSVIGNHDYCTYAVGSSPKDHVRMLADLISREKSFGWEVLQNEHRILRRGSDSLALIGVENVGRPPFPAKGDLKKAQQGLPEGMVKILLSHDPTHWRRETLPQTDIALQLSGHTHAMQFKIGSWSPSSLTYREWGGLYKEGEQQLFISTGGGGNVPFRLGAWPEIVVITLAK